MTRKSSDHFKDEWSSVFEISDKSPSGLVWKIARGKNIKAGAAAGWQTELDYWKVEYKSKTIAVHRIVYFLHYGSLDPYKIVDHKDGLSYNNNPANLREIPYAENCRNKKKPINNVSGTTGVHEVHEWVATWSENGKNCQKSFKVSKFGNLAKSMAEEYRELKIKELNEMNYNYTERHGQ